MYDTMHTRRVREADDIASFHATDRFCIQERRGLEF